MASSINFAIVSYPVTDWLRAKQFYGGTLGMPVAAFIDDTVGWMEYGEKAGVHFAINLVQGPISQCNGGGTAIFSVEDAYKAIEDLRSRGVRCEDVIAIPGMVTYANFYDPDGNRLQIAGPPPKS
ncbi:MAG: VOC family protein [Anaerolineaceae bacterium]